MRGRHIRICLSFLINAKAHRTLTRLRARTKHALPILRSRRHLTHTRTSLLPTQITRILSLVSILLPILAVLRFPRFRNAHIHSNVHLVRASENHQFLIARLLHVYRERMRAHLAWRATVPTTRAGVGSPSSIIAAGVIPRSVVITPDACELRSCDFSSRGTREVRWCPRSTGCPC